MPRESGGARFQAPDWLWLAAAGVALLLVARYVLGAGTWLDEYWQVWVSGAPADALAERLAADAHPPWFNLAGRLILLPAGGAIVAARIVSLLAASAALGAGLIAMRGLDSGVRWRILLLVIASAGPIGMTELAASFRVYPWLLVFAALQGAVLLAVAERRPVGLLLAAAVTAVSIVLHYVHAAGAIAIALVTLALAWRRGDRRVLYGTGAGLAAGILIDLVTGLIQLPQWRQHVDVNWIAESGGGALPSFLDLAANLPTFNVIALILIAAALLSRTGTRAGWLLAPIPLALAAWFVMDAVTPMIVPRYLASVTALVAVAAAAAWRDLQPRPVANAVAAVLVALQPLLNAWIHPPLLGWEAGARIAANIRKACPDAPVYAVSGWRVRDHPDSSAAQFEEPVMALAYATVAHRYGFTPRFVTGPTAVRSGACPAIIWFETAHGIEGSRVAAVLERARLTVPPGTTARFVPFGNGALLLLGAPNRPIPNFSQLALQRQP